MAKKCPVDISTDALATQWSSHPHPLQYYVKYDIIISDEQFLLRFIGKKQTTKERVITQGGKIMAKKVRYNGGTQSYYGCSDPTNLVVGKEYEVVLSKDRGWQTDYILKGVSGQFNSVWFDEVSPDDKVYMAIAHKVPVIGEKYSCYRMEFSKVSLNLLVVLQAPSKESTIWETTFTR